VSCGESVEALADNELSPRCKLRDGGNGYCILPGSYIIPISLLFKKIEDKQKYIEENAKHYSKFYDGDQSDIHSTLNTEKMDHYKLLRELKKNEKEIKEAHRFGRSSEESRDADQRQIEKERSDSFLDWNKYFQEKKGIKPEYVMNVMEMIASFKSGKLNKDSKFIVPGLCKGGGLCRTLSGADSPVRIRTTAIGSPTRYIVLEKSTVRAGPEKSDPKVGEYARGQEIMVVSGTTNSVGLEVLQSVTPCGRKGGTGNGGWVKLATSKGRVLLEKVEDEQRLESSEPPEPGLGRYERSIADLVDWESIVNIDNKSDWEVVYEMIMNNIFTYPVERDESHKPGEETREISPLGLPFMAVVPSNLKEGDTTFMVRTPYTGITVNDKIIVITDPRYRNLVDSAASSQADVVPVSSAASSQADVVPVSSPASSQADVVPVSSPASSQADVVPVRELQEKKGNEENIFERDPVEFLKEEYLKGFIAFGKEQKNDYIYHRMGVQDHINEPKFKDFKEYVEKLQGYIDRSINIGIDNYRKGLTKHKRRDFDTQYEKLKGFKDKCCDNSSHPKERKYYWPIKSSKFRSEGIPEDAINFVEKMRRHLTEFIEKKMVEIFPNTKAYRKSVNKRGGGQREDEYEYIEPFKAYPESMKEAIDDYIRLKEIRKRKDKDNLIINGPHIIIQMDRFGGADIRRIDCPLNLGKKNENGNTDRAKRLSISECQNTFNPNQFLTGGVKRSRIMQSLYEKQEFGSAELLGAISRFIFNEIALDGLKEQKLEDLDYKRNIETQRISIERFQNARKSIKEDQKIIKVLEDYKKVNEASGETLEISLEDFCKENGDDGRPRMDISKTDLINKRNEVEKNLKQKKQSISDIISNAEKQVVFAYVKKETGLRFCKTDDGCWYGYQNWISPDDRKKEKESCRPLKVITKNRVGTWRKIGDATYDRFKYESVAGADLHSVNENHYTVQSQSFIDQLIERKGEKIKSIKEDYENPKISISSTKFKTECLELEEIYSILGSVGITDDNETDVVIGMAEMEKKISSMTKGEDEKEGAESSIKFKYHSPFINVGEHDNWLTDKVPKGSIIFGVPLKYMSSEMLKTIDGEENQIPDLRREPVTFSKKVERQGGGLTWLCNLAVIKPTETMHGEIIRDPSKELSLDHNQEITLLPPDIVVCLGGEDGIKTNSRWQRINYSNRDKFKSYLNYLKNNLFMRYLKKYLIGKIGQIVGTLIVVVVLSFIFPPAIPFILPFIGSAKKIGNLFGLFNIPQGGGSYNNIKINYLSNRNIIKDKKLIKDKNKITKKRKGKSRNRKKITTKNKKSKRYYK